MTFPLVFVDTNVIVYSRDSREVAKQPQASAWLSALASGEHWRINLQILNELTNVLLRRGSATVASEIRDSVDLLAIWGSEPITEETAALGWEVRGALGFQWFDCLLVAAAYLDDCTYLLSENMAHGARFGHVTIIDPFKTHPSEYLKA